MKRNITLLALLIFMLSCQKKEESNYEKKKKNQEYEQQEKDKLINEISQKYQASFLWDTIHYNYTINYESILLSKCQLIDKFGIEDISKSKSDDFYHLFLYTNSYKKGSSDDIDISFYFDLSLTNDVYRQISKYIKEEECYSELERHEKNEAHDFVLVVKIDNIKKVKFSSVDKNDSDDDNQTTYMTIDGYTDFIGKGEIIDVISLVHSSDGTVYMPIRADKN